MDRWMDGWVMRLQFMDTFYLNLEDNYAKPKQLRYC